MVDGEIGGLARLARLERLGRFMRCERRGGNDC
jgi:hypothetical protein